MEPEAIGLPSLLFGLDYVGSFQTKERAGLSADGRGMHGT